MQSDVITQFTFNTADSDCQSCLFIAFKPRQRRALVDFAIENFESTTNFLVIDITDFGFCVCVFREKK